MPIIDEACPFCGSPVDVPNRLEAGGLNDDGPTEIPGTEGHCRGPRRHRLVMGVNGGLDLHPNGRL